MRSCVMMANDSELNTRTRKKKHSHVRPTRMNTDEEDVAAADDDELD